MGCGKSLGGGFFVPRACVAVILRDALTVGVEDTEVTLGCGKTFGGGFFEPGTRFAVVLCHTLPVSV